jgi:hypothetical protein
MLAAKIIAEIVHSAYHFEHDADIMLAARVKLALAIERATRE